MQEQIDYRKLYNAMLEGFDAVNVVYFAFEVIYDKNGKPTDLVFKEASPATEKLMGKGKDEIIGKTRKQIFGDTPDDFPSKLDAVLKSGNSTRFQTFGPGLKKYYDVYAWKFNERTVAGLLLDITDRKKAEEALQSSEKQKTDILESITDGFVAFDKEWRYTYVNSNAAKILHASKAELIGKVAIDVFPNAAKFLIEFKRAVSSGHPVHFEEYYPEPLNVWYECHCYPSQDGLTVFFSDITHRKKAEEAIKQSEEQSRQRAEELQKLMDIIPAAIWVSNDPECKVIVGNKTANQFYEAAGGENVSAGPARGGEKDTTRRFFKDGKELQPEELPMQEAAFKNKEIKNSELEVLAPSGRKMTILGSAKPLLTNEGKVRGCLAAFMDITERKKVEEALHLSEERFRIGLKNAPVSVAVQDCTLRYIWAYNQKTAQPNEIIGKLDKEIFTPEEAARLDVIKRRVLKEGVELREQQWYNRPSGPIFLDVTWSPLHDSKGKIIGVASATIDLTDMKRTEIALQESEQRWATTLASVGDAVIATDLSGNIVFMNGKAEELTGWMLVETSLKPVKSVFKIINEQTRLEVESPIDRVLKEGIVCGLANHTLLIRKDGSEVPIDDSGAPIKDKDGKITGVVLIFRDITERKKAEEAVARQAELIDLSPDAIIVRKLNGTITFWSKGAEKLYGLTKNEAIGQDINELLKTEFPLPLEKILKKLKLDGKWSGEIVHTCKNGDRLVLQSFWLAKFDANGKIIEMLESNVDITQLIELQTKLEESAVRVEEYANQMEELANNRAAQLRDVERLAAIGATAGMVGHDIRNPLQAITGDLFLTKSELSELPENENKTNALESLDEIQNNIDYINKIVADLQDYARPLNPQAQETDVESVFNEILPRNGVPKNIKVSVDIEGEAKRIMADPDYLKRIAANLTLNAVQAMPEGGKLKIHAYADKTTGDVLITFEDTGVGIPEGIKPKLFTPMMTTKSKGQGFGLAVVKRMTEGLGGTVSFESSEGKGTKFTVRLPPK